MKYLQRHRSTLLSLALSSATILLGAPQWAFSHGMRPMVRQIVNQTGFEIHGIQLTRGLAQRLADGRWQFTCPHFCNKTMYPLVTSASPNSMWVAGNSDFFRLEGGLPTPTNRSSLSGGRLRGMKTIENQVLALQFVPPTSSQLIEIPREGPATTIQEFATPYNFMKIADGIIYLALGHLDTITVLELSLEDFSVIRKRVWDAPQISDILGINSIANRLYLAVRFMDRNSLLAMEETAVELANSVYQTTVPFDDNGTLLTIIDSRLHELNDSTLTLTPIDTPEDIIYEHFHKTPYGNFVSTARGLFRFNGHGEPMDEIFLMDELHPPLLDGLSGRELEFCETHWADLKRDWGLPEEPMVRSLPSEAQENSENESSADTHESSTVSSTLEKQSQGCSQRHSPYSWLGSMGLIGALFLRQRYRRLLQLK